jgi:hypothetical protein
LANGDPIRIVCSGRISTRAPGVSKWCNRRSELIHEDLLYVLDDAHAKRGKVVGLNDPIIKTEAGIGFTVAGFSDWFRDAITAAGLPLDCKPRGLRHLAGARMSEAGCTDEEMMAVLSHRSATSLRIYTKGAEQRRLGDNAITKVEQNRDKASQHGPSNLGNCRKEKGTQAHRKSVALPSGLAAWARA